MAQVAAYDTIFRGLVSIINSLPPEKPATLEAISRAFHDIHGKQLPFREEGFPTLLAMFESRPDLFLVRNIKGQCIVKACSLPQASKIKSMVEKQTVDRKSAKKFGELIRASNTLIPELPAQHREFIIPNETNPQLPNFVNENLSNISHCLPDSLTIPQLQRQYTERFSLSLDWSKYGFLSEEQFALYLSQNVYQGVFICRNGKLYRPAGSSHSSDTTGYEQFKENILNLLESETGYTVNSLLHCISSARLSHVQANEMIKDLSKDPNVPLTVTELPSGEIIIGSGRSRDSGRTIQCLQRPDNRPSGIIRVFYLDEQTDTLTFYFVNDFSEMSSLNPSSSVPPLLSTFKPLTMCSMRHSSEADRWLHYIITRVYLQDGLAFADLQCLDRNHASLEKLRLPSPNLYSPLPKVATLPLYTSKFQRCLEVHPVGDRLQQADVMIVFLPSQIDALNSDETALLLDADGLEIII